MSKLTTYILKHQKEKDSQLKYDFMPPLLEIIERPMHTAGTIIILAVFSLFAIAVIWAAFSKIDILVTATGNLQPVENIDIINAPSNAIINKINVSEGQFVNQNDILVELDIKSLNIDVMQLQRQKEILNIQSELYENLLCETPKDVNIQDYNVDDQLYVQTILDLEKSYNQSISSLENEIASAKLTREAAQIQLDEYSTLGLAQQIQMQEISIKQADISIKQLNLKLESAETNFYSQIRDTLFKTNEEIIKITNELEKYEISKENQQIKAPNSGYVNSIAIKNVGETVTFSQKLISIVPSDATIEMVCHVNNMYISDIYINMPVEIKLDTYPYNEYGTVKGNVNYISANSTINDRGQSFYVVKITIAKKQNTSIDLICGLSGQVEFKIGKRSILDYFLDPIIKGFDESLREK